MKRCLQNDDSTINEGASSSKSRSTNIVNECSKFSEEYKVI